MEIATNVNRMDGCLCKYAIKKLTNPQIIIELARNHPDSWTTAGEMTDNQDTIVFLLQKAEGYNYIGDFPEKMLKKRKAYVEQLSNQSELAEIAMNERGYFEYGQVRDIALKNLSEQTLLAKVAKNAENSYTRFFAAKKLTDKILAQSVYVDIAKNARKNDYNLVGVIEEIKKITDKETLVDIAKNAKNPDILMAVVEKLTDKVLAQQVYVKLATEFGNIKAIIRMTDPTILNEIINNEISKQQKLNYIDQNYNSASNTIIRIASERLDSLKNNKTVNIMNE